jgi:hypothetical protein
MLNVATRNVGRASAAAGIARIEATARTTVCGEEERDQRPAHTGLYKATETLSHRENQNTLCLWTLWPVGNDL